MRLTILFLLAALAFVPGCGVKPGGVDAPPGAGADHFPRTYPDPATDPK